jgi:hypothetical protein
VLYCLEQPEAFTHVAYFDADFSAPLSQIYLLTEAIEQNPKVLVAFGSRIKRLGGHIERTLKRHLLGRIFSTAASLLLKLPIYDTQCGAKLFEVGLAKQIFNTPFISRWLFDIELFARIVKLYGKQTTLNIVLEVPLNYWAEVGQSKLRISYFIKVPFELWQIYRQYKAHLGGR